ncbi:aspartyl protease family protein [Candidatus Xenohaliotis californiensis]|uniref:Aspartyl protease family protein n=1 Tax=Candidatus Xenohaliotis californiensis TaxID=84677 RepID=A0ABM9N9H4_9RICK|nr:aspartyl protease family protein [Candidatus Xenohaliotis californiensis]
MNKIIIIVSVVAVTLYYFFTFKLWLRFNKKTLSYAAAWLVIIFLSIILYVHKSSVLNNSLVAAISPSKGYHTLREAVYYKANDGHFYIDAFVGRVKIKFIVDTGASGIAITPDDAIRLGVSLSSLHFTEDYETASGTTRAAPAVIPMMRIGDFVLKDVKVSINESPSSISLMGMSVLERFNIHISNEKIILSQ